jgi:hypothetical protein
MDAKRHLTVMLIAGIAYGIRLGQTKRDRVKASSNVIAAHSRQNALNAIAQEADLFHQGITSNCQDGHRQYLGLSAELLLEVN